MLRLFPVVLALFLFSFSPAAAEDSSLYDAEIYVDVTAENASVARERAMNEANRKALMTVANRITTASGAAVLNPLNSNQILNFIKEVTVESEKVSDVRYLANLKVTINADILKSYLQEKNAPYTMVSESTVLIIPTFREFQTDAPLLWDDNPWRQSWVENPLTSGPIKISSLEDSSANRMLLNAEQALRLDGLTLDQIAKAYSTRNLYVADAVYDGIEGLNVTLTSYQTGTQETINIKGERGPQLFNDAVQQVKERILGTIQQQSYAENQNSEEITVIYTPQSLKDWINAERKLKQIASIENITVEALSADKVQFRLRHLGSHEKLLHELRNKFLNLRAYDSFYTLEQI